MNLMPLLSEAERYLEVKDIDRAAELFARCDELCAGTSPFPLLGLARIALLTGRHEEGRTLVDAVLLRFPKCAEALTVRGSIEEAAGRIEMAIAFHTRALMIDATVATAHVNLGRCHAQCDRWDLAAASLQLAVQHGALTPEVKVMLGTALFRSGKTKDALKVLTLTVNAHPRHLDAILTLADVLVETGALGLAAELLDNAAPRLPDAPLIPSRRAAIALRMKDLEAAQREAWRHTQLAPKDEEAWLFAAVVDTMRLHFDTAEKALKTVLKLNPDNWRAHYHLGGLSDAIKDKTHAKKCYRAAIEANPHAWEPMNNLAIMLLEEGTASALREARVLLDRAIRCKVTPDSIVTHYNLALACFRLGDVPAARRAAQSLLKLAPVEHPMAGEAHRLMKIAA